LRYPIFETFDRPDAGSSCAVRDRSTTALQSLQMINSQFSWSAAQALASRVDQLIIQKPGLSHQELQKARIEALFEIALARQPSDAEMQLFIDESHAGKHGDPETSEYRSSEFSPALCLAILNCTEFVTLD
jgi:NOL1/NOP2/fmu family ribosome biogenesis protein